MDKMKLYEYWAPLKSLWKALCLLKNLKYIDIQKKSILFLWKYLVENCKNKQNLHDRMISHFVFLKNWQNKINPKSWPLKVTTIYFFKEQCSCLNIRSSDQIYPCWLLVSCNRVRLFLSFRDQLKITLVNSFLAESIPVNQYYFSMSPGDLYVQL